MADATKMSVRISGPLQDALIAYAQKLGVPMSSAARIILTSALTPTDGSPAAISNVREIQAIREGVTLGLSKLKVALRDIYQQINLDGVDIDGGA